MSVSVDARYRVGRQIGAGGYARVYLAEDLVLGRTVALKQFAAESAEPRHRERMRTESRLLASLAHPSLVTLFDADLSADPPYLVMEYIDGPTLREVIGSGPMEPRRVRRLAVHLADAVAFVHSQGIVHRDIKPSNVLLRPGSSRAEPWTATLADFGIASLVDTARLTAVGTVVGTPAYLSPEQVRGAPPAPPADIYSLGLVLLEALSGQVAFDGATPHEALAARLTAPPAIPDGIDPFWRRLIARMTAVDPERRPTAAEVRDTASESRTSPRTRALATRIPPVRQLPAAAADSSARRHASTPTRVMIGGAQLAATAESDREATRGRVLLIAVLIVIAIATAVAVVATVAGAVVPASPPFDGLPQPLQDDLTLLWREAGR